MLIGIYFPTQNLLSDAECKICKYKSLIISVYSSNYGGQILCRGTEEGRKIYKHLQMKLPSKIKYTNICKDVFPVLCIFTFVNTDSCTFLYSLRSEWRATSNFCPFRYIYLCSSLYIFVIWQKWAHFITQNWLVKKCWHCFLSLCGIFRNLSLGGHFCPSVSLQALILSLLRNKYIL